MTIREILQDTFSSKQIDDFYTKDKDIVSTYKERQFQDNYTDTFTTPAPKLVFDRKSKLL